MRKIIAPLLAAGSLGLLAAPALAGNSGAPLGPREITGASAPSCAGSATRSPNVGPGDNWLESVAATSACNAWAVGHYSNTSHTHLWTMIEHWDGQAWKVQSSPSPSSSDNELYGVAATSATNAWAVGFRTDARGAPETLIEHWNGTAWTVQPSPNAGVTPNGELTGVVATSATNAWAVGFYDNSKGNGVTLIEHWDGKAWKVQPSPQLGASDSDLRAVAASSSSNAWAVGKYYNGTAERTLIEHWNGQAWNVQPSPNAGSPTDADELDGVAAISSTSAWVVGDVFTGGAFHALVERWNGQAWQVQPSAHRGSSDALTGVAATSASNVWAVGDYDLLQNTLTERWNGTAWRLQPSSGPAGRGLTGVAAVSPADAWAVGIYFNEAGVRQTLIRHWNGKTWSG
jgi:hypothetical protein